MKLKSLMTLGLAATIWAGGQAAQAQITLNPIGNYETGIFDGSAAEIAAYDPASKRLFVTNAEAKTIDILDLSNPSKPTLITSLELPNGANSVAFHDGILAAAVEGNTPQMPGQVIFFDAMGKQLNAVTVGALPDMLTFTPDGQKVVVANEGEPNEDYSEDPEGSVSIIDLSQGIAQAT
ncbi:MAG: hypothetical protein VKJ86_11190, partial [Synechococcus sp.]|nr:hypothetical protein [Synechococcus sp.]